LSGEQIPPLLLQQGGLFMLNAVRRRSGEVVVVVDCVMSGLEGVGYTRRLFRKFDLRVPTTMEINPILNAIKDLSERTLSIRGYL
jgi:hypothetical protein